MNPFNLDATGLMIWGLVAHLVADWPLQNDYLARNKASLKHPAAYVHAAIHGIFLSLVFGWAAIILAFAHLLIDTRKPLVWWSKLVRQTQPQIPTWIPPHYDFDGPPVMDVGMEVRFWTDQVFHIICIAVAALVIG